MAIQDGMDGTDGWQADLKALAADLLADLGCAPTGVITLDL
jgi:hypothetical protein